eukprot:3925573-Prymnesium_polylepis.1
MEVWPQCGGGGRCGAAAAHAAQSLRSSRLRAPPNRATRALRACNNEIIDFTRAPTQPDHQQPERQANQTIKASTQSSNHGAHPVSVNEPK